MKIPYIKLASIGIVVFLALPVIFEKDAKNTALQSDKALQEEDYESMEIFDAQKSRAKSALPFRSSNPFSRFARKVGNFYGGILKGGDEKNEEFLVADSDSEEIIKALQEGRAKDRSAVESGLLDKGASSSGGVSSGLDFIASNPSVIADHSAQRQMNGDLAVKGLYEVSSADSYEQRALGKAAYTQVMKKIDSSSAPAGSQVYQASAKKTVTAFSDSGDGQAAAPGRSSSSGGGNNYGGDSAPVGIASRYSSDGAGYSASSSGSSSGFSGGGVSASKEDGGVNLSGFEESAKTFKKNLRGTGLISSSGGGVNAGGSSSGSASNNPQTPGQSKPGTTEPGKPGKPGDKPSQPSNPDNPGQQPGDKPQIKVEVKAFDPALYKAAPPMPDSCDMHAHSLHAADAEEASGSNKGAGGGFTSFDVGSLAGQMAVADSTAVGKPGAQKPADDDTIEISYCGGGTELPEISKDVQDKYKFVIDLGAVALDQKKDGAMGGFVKPTDKTAVGQILDKIGIKIDDKGLPVKDKDGKVNDLFTITTGRDFTNASVKNDVIVITVQPEKTSDAAPIKGPAQKERTINIAAADLEKKSGINNLVQRVNFVPAMIAAKEKADAEARQVKLEGDMKELGSK